MGGSFTAVKQTALCHVLSGKRGEREYLPMLLLTKHIFMRAGLLPISFVDLNSDSYSSGAITLLLASVIILSEGKAAKQGSLNKC